jgi:hypothetical protein
VEELRLDRVMGPIVLEEELPMDNLIFDDAVGHGLEEDFWMVREIMF